MLVACVALSVVTCLLSPVASRIVGRSAGWVLAVPLLAAAGLVVAASPRAGESVDVLMPWMPTLDVGLSLRLDGLSLLFALLVLVIGAGVLFYSARYLGAAGRHESFYLLMTTFAAAMLVLVLADDLVVLFVAWEITTLCSFFLIARSGEGAREPAVRTLLVTVAGGLCLLAAVAVMAAAAGTTRVSEVLAHPFWADDPTTTTIVAVLLAMAAFTKSAQFPFQSWLPDSMVAITPVSAYLHAAAMVKAGIYLLLRFSPVLAEVPVWNLLLISSGLLTALLGAVSALRRHDLKELLAYSTISQLGLLVAMIGVGTPEALLAAVVHTIAHALFKAALFMLVGVIDHEAGTRDIRELRGLRLRMPITAVGLGLAATSMAGVPLMLGFISKESMFTAFLDAPLPGWLVALITLAAATTSILTLAYSGRLVLGAFSGRSETEVREAPAAFWAVPVLGATAGLLLGVAPFLLDTLAGNAASATAGHDVEAHLVLWHGFTAALGVSVIVLTLGVVLIVMRRRVDRFLAPMTFPISGLAIVDGLRARTISVGAEVGSWAGSRSPRRHLAIPAVCLIVMAALAAASLDSLPPVEGNPSRQLDWVLVVLVAAGVLAAVSAQTRISALVVTGVVGFTMTLWFFVLGAADVALTQLLVEILTVCVMVLLLQRLPARFRRDTPRQQIPAAVIAIGAGVATTLGVWALTGRRGASDAASYYLREGEEITGGANVVNTILVDFRALDTLGELTVLGVAGVAVAALLKGRRPSPRRPATYATSSPLAHAADNAVFARTVARALVPLIILGSVLLLLRGHQEPGGGFIAALVGGAGIALLYLTAPSDDSARIGWPYLTLIGAGVAVGTATGLVGFLDGSFLRPLHGEVLGTSLTTALVFDVGVYLAVVGVVLASFNLLGRQQPPDPGDDVEDHPRASPDREEADAP